MAMTNSVELVDVRDGNDELRSAINFNVVQDRLVVIVHASNESM